MISNPFDKSELHEAVLEGDVERVRRLLDDGADVNARAGCWTTARMSTPAPGTRPRP